MTTVVGSAVAMGGISTMPAPTRLRRDERVPADTLPDPRVAAVSRETSTRPDTRPEPPPVPGVVPAEAEPGLAGASSASPWG